MNSQAKNKLPELIEAMKAQLASPSDQVIADFFGVNRSTCQRWKKASTVIREENLERIPTKLGCPNDVFERCMRGEIEVQTLLAHHAPHWVAYHSECEKFDEFIKNTLKKANVTNVAKMAEASVSLLSAHVGKTELPVQKEDKQTIQDLINATLKRIGWGIERNGLERLAENASLSSGRIKEIWLGGRPDYNELVKLAVVLGKSSDELIAIRDRQYGGNGESLPVKESH